jgi:hypothetical protein
MLILEIIKQTRTPYQVIPVKRFKPQYINPEIIDHSMVIAVLPTRKIDGILIKIDQIEMNGALRRIQQIFMYIGRRSGSQDQYPFLRRRLTLYFPASFQKVAFSVSYRMSPCLVLKKAVPIGVPPIGIYIPLVNVMDD